MLLHYKKVQYNLYFVGVQFHSYFFLIVVLAYRLHIINFKLQYDLFLMFVIYFNHLITKATHPTQSLSNRPINGHTLHSILYL